MTGPNALTGAVVGWTPGPWSVEADMRSERMGDMWDSANGYREYLAGWNVLSDDGDIVGIEGICPGDTGKANAKLIAAAPDLYAALTTARQALVAVADSAAEAGFDQLSGIIAIEMGKVNAALAKARGEGA